VNHGPIRLLIEQVDEQARSLLRELERLRSKDFPLPLATTILDGLDETIKAFVNRFDELKTDDVLCHPEMPDEERVASIQTHAAQLALLHQVFGLLDDVDSTRVPFELVPIFQAAADQLLSSETPSKLLLQPVREYNYSILELTNLFSLPPWQNLSERFEQCFLLTLPSATPNDILSHTLFFHELGHPLFSARLSADLDHHVMERFAVAIEEHQDAINKAVDERLKSMGVHQNETPGPQQSNADIAKKQQHNSLVGKALGIVSSWVEEICCDVVAARIVGPSYVCAYQSVLLPFFPSAGFSATHPDDGTRLKVISWYLAQSQQKQPVLAELMANYGASAEAVAGLGGGVDEGMESAVVFRLAQWVVRPDETNKLLSVTAEKIDALIPDPLEYEGLLPALKESVSALDGVIPPDPFVFLSRAASLDEHALCAFVFHALWLYRLKGFQVWREQYGWDDGHCRDVLNGLGLKALEAASLEKSFSQRGTA
jgi:hypothetical protein